MGTRTVSLKNIGLLPAAAFAIAIWNHDVVWLALLGLGLLVDWFCRWGWAAPEISGTEQEVLDAFHAAQAEHEMPEGMRRLRVLPRPAEEESEPQEGA